MDYNSIIKEFDYSLEKIGSNCEILDSNHEFLINSKCVSDTARIGGYHIKNNYDTFLGIIDKNSKVYIVKSNIKDYVPQAKLLVTCGTKYFIQYIMPFEFIDDVLYYYVLVIPYYEN